MTTAHDPSRVRVIVVDDNRAAASALAVLLRKARFTVLAEAHDGAQALQAIDEFRPDVALLDIVLPDLDGFEVADRVRRQFVAPPRLIAVSGLAQPCDRADALKAGFAAYFSKPLAWWELEELLLSFTTAETSGQTARA